ncbi:Predicted component of the ribosome quality control (RQC) complex, YloA/Tae2 family, contains fibronectin-binding (FbpA) and DUF814 domains [Caloramator fervidus]|uniref:Rqc2 homolog RqcH n=1 Tax=Caloramator fervidus TaxID=29344 RepID=A0A1H5TZH2_9CLOT|nr:NFACT RNA binding domain-containing protein [Caloramator fervidus]SEF68206.1 Predicted component of the ribosome quality control (RQC) complex, YloA/Tae2 family, contains fibronectin-binding (FbpA) and DUF814 domains [Caloramator fervidus]
MPMDGVFIKAIVQNLSDIVGSKLDKIYQPSKDDIIIHLRKNKSNYKLLLSCNPSSPRIQITNINRNNPDVAPNFVMVLRKHILNSKIIEINQLNFDRIVEIKLESKDELGYLNYYHLIIEIMGKHSNIILLNDKYIIVDAIKHLNSDINRYRIVLPGANYILPPTNNRINPLNITNETFNELLSKNTNKKVSSFFLENFLGLSKIFINQICGKYENLNINELNENDILTIRNKFFYYLSKIKSNDFDFFLYRDNNNKLIDYYVFDIDDYKNYKKEKFSSPFQLLDIYYSEKDFQDLIKQKYNDLIKIVKGFIEKNNKKIEQYINKINECKNYELYKIYADILMANQYNIKPNLEKIILPNFYDPDYTPIEIPLDVNLNIIENAQKYYKKYSKEKNTVETLTKQLEEAKLEKEYLEGILFSAEKATDFETLEEIKKELISMGYLKQKKESKKEIKSKPHHYISSDGYDIYVGKNNIQNDYLTLKFAKEDDIWLHTKNIPGSHVIIKSKNGKVSDTALIEAAHLAAYYSKARESTNVPVDYTERKNVKKPSGSKPGMVIYYTNKTIFVTPNEEKIKTIQKID